MEEHDTDALKRELEQFKKEKDAIRKIVGQIGGVKADARDRLITRGFIAAIITLFVLDVLRHLLHLDVPLPPLFSLELGVLFVSLKIVWMMHRQAKVEHFQFWILNSIEFRLNDVAKKLQQIEKGVVANPDSA